MRTSSTRPATLRSSAGGSTRASATCSTVSTRCQPAGATSRNRRPSPGAPNRSTAANRDLPQPPPRDGKEGVSGSSPEEGSREGAGNGAFLLVRRPARARLCMPMSTSDVNSTSES
jgi:hypothetical protein